MMHVALLLAGCTGSTVDTALQESDEPGIVVESEPESPYFEPIALSVGYTGGWDEYQDALMDWAYKGEGYDGYIKLTLVSARYFELSPDDPAREDEFCEIRALYHAAPAALEAASQSDDTPAVLRAGFEGHLEIYGFLGTQCYNLDPAVWENGDPQAVFDGMRLGLGFAELTDFLADAWTDDTLAFYGNYMLAAYVAINQPDGAGGVDFVARDWSTALLWQWDAASGEVLINDEGALMGQDINDPLLSGWVSCYPYWFEDLSRFDLSRLREGVIVEE